MMIGHIVYRKVISVFVLVLLIALPSMGSFERVNDPNPDDMMDVAIFQLENGLTVYITENYETPRFYAEIAVRAGSMHDPEESTGLAHYLEHMLFKGTTRMGTLDYEAERSIQEEIERLYDKHFHETDPEKRRELFAQINELTVQSAAFAIPNEIDQLYQSMGGSGINAFTSNEETVYTVSLPANRIRQWAVVESERFREPVFRLFQPELEVVYEEMNQWLDNRFMIIFDAVKEQLFKVHPYGQRRTIGTVEHLKNPSLNNIHEFYNTYYVPNNMAIFISGAIDTQETIEIIAEHFAGWEPAELPVLPEWEEPPLEGREYVERTYRGEEYVTLAFRTATVNHPDAEALMLFDMVLDNATAGLINLNLNQRQLVRSAGCSPWLLNEHGMQIFYGVPRDEQSLEEVEALLLEQIELVKQGEFEDWLIPAIINDFKMNEMGALESDNARVSMMRRSWTRFQDWDDAIKLIHRIEQLDKNDVIRVANTYFGDDYVVGYRKDAPHEVPDIEKPELANVDIDPRRRSDFARAILEMPVEPIEPEFVNPETDFERRDTDYGVTWYHVHNPINDIFNFSITVDFGSHEDNTIQLATMLLDKAGTREHAPEELKKEWYKLGTSFSINAGDNETNITLTGLDEHFEASVALLYELLNNPVLEDEGVLEQMKRIVLLQREDAKKEVESITSALVTYNRYGEDSYFLRMLPTDGVLALTTEDLLDVIRNLLGYKHVINYTGTHTLDTIYEIVSRHHPVESMLKDPPLYRYLTAREPEETEIYLYDREGAQARVRLEFGDVMFNAIEIPIVHLFNNYFAGGMSGIVFQELREARALAYMAGARYLLGYRADDQNLMIGVIQTQTDKTLEATEAFIDLIENIPESPERFSLARESTIEEFRTGKIGFRSIANAVRAWERRNQEPDPRKAYFEVFQQSELDQVLEFHKNHLKGRPILISIVGDTARMDVKALEQVGKVVRITEDMIFVD